ncbi:MULTISPECIES: multicopper oxidase family protein [Actinoalloteichus]|uniref:Multicopper oxidase n=1 Tax=Actinoalloteichus fjordicus TaxID=1612552 RepID=A0AAC9LH75_9PSEU|nr:MULTISPECIES: multicopper oxidase domain-containing protein [Actinoalloteichus]APU16830.1 putative multicopper oxidase [Actinoalloteichus fjordicus]APU22895.1 putative multicopper oxidase [Actinoalloteichus sp. GBA129-24]
MNARVRRRRFRILKILIGLSLVTGLVVGAGALVLWSTAVVDTADEMEFDTPLSVPPLAESTVDGEGRRVFDLEVREGSHEFTAGRSTPTWGVNGDYLGPTLRASRGEEVLVNVTNDVGEPTTLHWHGMHLPARMDGGPHQMIDPGETWSPTWRIEQPAASLWYHPHLHGSTQEHVYRGVAGMFLLDDERSGQVGLPDEYGVDDFPLVVQDKKFAADGTLDTDEGMVAPSGLLGDTVAVNGTVGGYLDVTTEKVRLRLLNGSGGRFYDFGLADGGTVTMVASDGGLLPAPLEIDRVLLSPGERAEIVVEMAPGEEKVLRSHPTDLGLGAWDSRFTGAEDTFDLVQLRAAESLAPSAEIAAELAPAPDLRAEDASETRRFRLSGNNINGRRMDMDRIDEVVTVGDTEIWEVSNSNGGTPHNFHVHDVQFRVLDLEGTPPPPELSGWKDTLYIRPNTTARIVMRFEDYTDPDYPYMFHCHLLQHEDRGMMGQFVVVEEGGSAGTPPAHDH